MATRRFPRVQFTIAELIAAIAGIAVACAWPVLRFPVVATGLIVLLHRLGLSLLQILIVAAVLGVALGLLLPPIGMP